MNGYIRLFRFQNSVIGVIGIVAAAFIASGTGIAAHAANVLLACIIVAVFMAGGNALNDYIDRDIDVVSHPERPIPSGRIPPRNAMYAGYAMLALASVLSLAFRDLLSIGIVAAACVLMLSYEMFLKQRGLAGNIAIAVLTGMIFLLGGAAAGNAEMTYALAGMAVLVNVGREITKDIEDMEGDEGRSTLPMRIGRRNAGMVAAAFLIAGPVLSVWPMFGEMFNDLYPLVIVPDAMFIYASYILFKDPHGSQKVAKIAMLIALAAFMIGVI